MRHSWLAPALVALTLVPTQLRGQDFDLHEGLRGIRSVTVRIVLAGAGGQLLAAAGGLDSVALRARVELQLRRSGIAVVDSAQITSRNAFYSIIALCNQSRTTIACSLQPFVMRRATLTDEPTAVRGLVWGGAGELLLSADWPSATSSLQQAIDQDLAVFINEVLKSRE